MALFKIGESDIALAVLLKAFAPVAKIPAVLDASPITLVALVPSLITSAPVSAAFAAAAAFAAVATVSVSLISFAALLASNVSAPSLIALEMPCKMCGAAFIIV